jgi:hypothetical protein
MERDIFCMTKFLSYYLGLVPLEFTVLFPIKKTKSICHWQIEHDIKFNFIGIVCISFTKFIWRNFVSEKGIGMFLPIVAIVFLVLANKAIKRMKIL